MNCEHEMTDLREPTGPDLLEESMQRLETTIRTPPTVPESAPRGETEYVLASDEYRKAMWAEAMSRYPTIEGGANHENSKQIARRWAFVHGTIHALLTSAPRPVPETAHHLTRTGQYVDCSCGFAWDAGSPDAAAIALRDHRAAHPAPPAPPAEPVEARECTCMYDKRDPNCPRHRPVEEAQRTVRIVGSLSAGGTTASAPPRKCSLCGRDEHGTAACNALVVTPGSPLGKVWNNAEDAAAFDEPGEVEDEGARPLTWPNPQVGGMRANIIARMVLDRTTPDTLAAAYVADFEEAFLTEAPAALEKMLFTLRDEWRAERTRAEAAEGALRERDEALWRAEIRIGILVGRMRGRDDHDGRTGEPDDHSLSIQEGEQWLADMAAEVNERASLIAEAVTPGAEG